LTVFTNLITSDCSPYGRADIPRSDLAYRLFCRFSRHNCEILLRSPRQNIYSPLHWVEVYEDMSLSQTEIIGFAADVITLLESEKEKLKQLGIDADKLIRELKELHEAAVSSNSEQESLKVAAKEATKTTVKLTRDLQVKASGDLDIVIGAYGKNSVDSKIIRRIRSKIKRREKQADAAKD